MSPKSVSTEEQDLDAAMGDIAPIPGGGGGMGFYCESEIAFGWGLFIKGLPSDQRFTKFDPFNKASVQAAQEKAIGFGASYGKTPAKTIALILHKETVKSREVNWDAGDQVKLVADWMGTPTGVNYKLWFETLKKLGIKKPGNYWVHVSLINDPGGKMERSSDDTRDVPSKMWIIDEVFPNEAACAKAAAEKKAEMDAAAAAAGEDEDAEPLPDDYDADVWADTKPDVLKELGDGSKGLIVKAAKKYGISVEFLTELYARENATDEEA